MPVTSDWICYVTHGAKVGGVVSWGRWLGAEVTEKPEGLFRGNQADGQRTDSTGAWEAAGQVRRVLRAVPGGGVDPGVTRDVLWPDCPRRGEGPSAL